MTRWHENTINFTTVTFTPVM